VQRYSPDTTASREKMNNAYAAAMKEVYNQHPSSGDAACLYADALMVEHPWDLYEQNQQPKPWTPPLVSVLEKTLTRFPNHPAANHYYIHAVEASATPGKALPSANLLSAMMPDVSHMVHMPSHTYIRTGNYKQGIDVNTSAINGFYSYSKQYPAVEELAGLYLSHNQHMQVACAMMQGSFAYALNTATQIRDGMPASYFIEPSAFNNYLQSMHMMPLVVELRFGKWQAILDSLMVSEATLSFEYAFQLFAKGMAAAHLKKSAEASSYLQQLQEKMKAPILYEQYASFANAAAAALKVSEQLLKGTIAETDNLADAITYYTKAVELEDGMLYGEPKDWLIPARHYLGNALLKAKQFKQAEEVYNKDLYVNPGNPWALYGLLQAQKGMTKNDISKTSAAFEKASAYADIKYSGSVVD
jgi:tetratricopeptide (TPR) repeat protein